MKIYVVLGDKVTKIDILKDVYYIGIKDKVIQFHIEDAICQQFVTIKDFEFWLADHGYIKLDKSNLVNMKKVKNIDFKRRFVTFPDGTTASISRRNISKLREYLDKPKQ